MKKFLFSLVAIVALTMFVSTKPAFAANTTIGTDSCTGYGDVVYQQRRSGQTTYRSYYRSDYFMTYNYLGDKVWDKGVLLFATFTADCQNDL